MKFKLLTFSIIDNTKYLLCDEILSDKCIFCPVNGSPTVGNYIDTYEYDIEWIKGIFAEGETIGLMDVGEDKEKGIHFIEPLNDEHIKKLQENDGLCRVELMDVPFVQDATNFQYQPIKIEDLIVLYYPS